MLTPFTPKERIDEKETSWGLASIHSFIAERGSVAFVISYSRYATNLDFEEISSNKMQKFFARYRDGALGKDGTLIRERRVEYKHHPGSEMELMKLNGQAHVMLRSYLISSNMVTLSTVFPSNYNGSSSTKKFFDSFQLAK